jgi:anti-sigma factor RsiW
MSGHISLERMHEALDGALAAAERDAIEAHVAMCAACRNEYARLSEVVASVRALPRSATPPDDVWAGIAARVGGSERAPASSEATIVALPVSHSDPAPARLGWTTGRRLVLSVPQLAAAAALVALISAATVWVVVGGGEAPPELATTATTPLEPLAGAAARAASVESGRYGEVVAQLESVLAEGRDILAPQTLATIEESLGTVDAAIAEVEEALAEDPGSDLLMRLLSTHRRTKLGVLQRAVSAVQAQT